jgi:hypothetical protein
MPDPLNRAERYRELAEECRRLAAIGSSTESRDRYLQMAERYSALAKAEELRSKDVNSD